MFWPLNFFAAGLVAGTTLFFYVVGSNGGYDPPGIPQVRKMYPYIVSIGVFAVVLNVGIGVLVGVLR